VPGSSEEHRLPNEVVFEWDGYTSTPMDEHASSEKKDGVANLFTLFVIGVDTEDQRLRRWFFLLSGPYKACWTTDLEPAKWGCEAAYEEHVLPGLLVLYHICTNF